MNSTQSQIDHIRNKAIFYKQKRTKTNFYVV